MGENSLRKARIDPVDVPFDVGNDWNISRTMANSKVAFTGFARFSAQLRRAELQPHLREIVILRIGALLSCDYEWGRHVPRAREAGLGDKELRALRTGELNDLGELERLVATYAESVERKAVTDELWGALAQRFAASELVELTTFASYYGFVCRFLLALRVELDDDVNGLEVP